MRLTHLFLTLSLLAASSISFANESPEALLQDKCSSCHGSEVYTRPDHKMNSLAQLTKQVRRCTQAAGASWFDEDITAVANFLDKSYYKFGQ